MVTEKDVVKFGEQCANIFAQVSRDVIGQKEVVEGTIIAMIAGGNVLLEGVPGVGKTRLVRSLGRVFDLPFKRIQFTPDLMPADVTGTNIIVKDASGNSTFQFQPGPIFSNIILADEINRATPKTQSALLEAMQERAITAAGVTRRLKQPFFVLATQNPIEQEGTYPLPEAQLDRFMFSVILDYPTLEEEIAIVENTTGEGLKKLNKIISGEEILEYQAVICKMPVPKHITEYAVKLVAKTRPGKPGAHELAEKYLNWGAGPRASQFLISGAKTYAALQGKYAPDMEDVKYVAEAILRHRIFKNYKAEAEHITVEELIREFMK